MPNDYEDAKKLGLTETDTFGYGSKHHAFSKRLMNFIMQHDFNDYGDFMCWKKGGDADNGEIVMYEIDAFCRYLDVIDGWPKMFYGTENEQKEDTINGKE